MPNRRKNYRDMERFRATCKIQNKRYYDKTAIYDPTRWTLEHDKAVLDHIITDTELSSIIGHSVRAIQIRRSRLKKALSAEKEVL